LRVAWVIATAQALAIENEVSNQSNDRNGYHRYSSPILPQWDGWQDEEDDYDECGFKNVLGRICF